MAERRSTTELSPTAQSFAFRDAPLRIPRRGWIASQRGGSALLHRLIRALTHGIFISLVTAILSSAAFWQVIPFYWQPITRSPQLFHRPLVLGWLTALPGFLILGWLLTRVPARFRRPWSWGRPSITIPLLGLTALMLSNLGNFPDWRPGYQVVGLGLTWLVYLFTVNERPPLILPLSLVTVIQSLAAIGQFIQQRSLDLVTLGELYLRPGNPGISVLWVNEQPWLRAYGLTAHPNFLGAVLAILLLHLMLALTRSSHGRQALLLPILALGFLGLLVSFSRAAWLAFGVGSVLWLLESTFTRSDSRDASGDTRVPALLIIGTLALIGLVFFVRHHELVLSRFLNLDTPTEARSLGERSRDGRLALQVILQSPWRGVGVGNYLVAARVLAPKALTVHNTSLLIGAELGLPGLLLWLWLALSPFRDRRTRRFPSYLAPWLAMLIIGLFDTTVWITVSWSSGVLFALLAAELAIWSDRAIQDRN